MIVFPPCKINVGLYITGKREDGFHSLESLFYPLPLNDALEIIPRIEGRGVVNLHLSGLPVPGDENENLIVKAYRLMHERFDLPSADIYLHKVIPMGAGLGGGSSDGAYMLRLLNELFDLPLTWDELLGFAAELGSDCPFFMQDRACFVSGRGEFIEPVDFTLKGKLLVLINPGIHISTAEAFSKIETKEAPKDWKSHVLNVQPLNWNSSIKNDFQEAILGSHPEIAEVIKSLKNSGAEYVSMTGTGSSCYGIFTDEPDIASLQKEDWFVKLIEL